MLNKFIGCKKLSFLMAHQMTVASNHENLEEGFSIHENLEVLLPVSNLKLEGFFHGGSNPWRASEELFIRCGCHRRGECAWQR
jgi:hypothetical protein